MSSLRVVKEEEVRALAYWQGITSTESQEYSFHVGLNHEISEGETKDVQLSLTVAMDAGFSFYGGSIDYNYS